MALPVHAMDGKGPKCVLCHSAGPGQSFGAIEAAIPTHSPDSKFNFESAMLKDSALILQ